MANIIQRIIQLVLDKDSAQKVQQDTEQVTGKMEETWKSAAKKIAGYLGIAFLTKQVIDFGRASVQQAADSEKAWASLANTIENAGGSFEKLEGTLRDTANAFQDATIHDDDAFAESLGRLVTLTDDVSASMNNMGLVANVAAKFFDGELAPATELVAKAMNGNINMLKKMGINAHDAQEALDILAQRSMGAATKEAETYSGQLHQLDEMYKDLQKSVGEAIIGSDGAADSFSVLKAALKTLTEWVGNNKQMIADWVTNGVKFAIDAADVFIRAVTGMANIIRGGLSTALGLAAEGIGKLLSGYAALREIEDNVQEKLGIDVTERKKFTQSIRDHAKALDEWGEAAVRLGSEKVAKGIDILATPMFSSADFSGAKPKVTPLESEKNRPQVGKNVKTDAGEAVEKAIKDFREATKQAENMQRILGDKFDATAADVDRTTKLLNVLAANGIDPASVGFAGLSDHLRDLVDVIVPTQTAAKELSKNLASGLAISAITARDSINPLQDRLAALKQQQGDVLKSIQTLVDAGIDPASESVTKLADRYAELGKEIKDTNLTATIHDLSVSLSQELFQATLDGATSLEKLQIEHQELQKTIQALIAQGVNKEDEAFKRLVARYTSVTDAIKKQTLAMQMQAAAADFLAEALGTALQGGLAEAASQKAKQNAIEAAEMLVRAGVFALFGDFPHASAALALAAQFGAVSVAWAALGAASRHGGGGGQGAPNVSGSVGGAGSALSSGRQSTSDAAAKAVDPAAEVSIYLTGPGFHAMNPEVQKVVRGASQQADERYGNARVRVIPQEH